MKIAIVSTTDDYTNVSALSTSALLHDHEVVKLNHCNEVDSSIDLAIIVGNIADSTILSNDIAYAILDSDISWCKCNGLGDCCFSDSEIDCPTEGNYIECMKDIYGIYANAKFLISTSSHHYEYLKVIIPKIKVINFGPLINPELCELNRFCPSRDMDTYVYAGPHVDDDIENAIKYSNIQEKGLYIPPLGMNALDRQVIYNKYNMAIHVPTRVDNLGTHLIEAMINGCDIITNTLCRPCNGKIPSLGGRYMTYKISGMHQYYISMGVTRSKIGKYLKRVQNDFWKNVGGCCNV